MSEYEETCPDCLREAEKEGQPMSHTPGNPCTTAVSCCPLHAAAPALLEACQVVLTGFNMEEAAGFKLSIAHGNEKGMLEEVIAHAEGRG